MTNLFALANNSTDKLFALANNSTDKLFALANNSTDKLFALANNSTDKLFALANNFLFTCLLKQGSQHKSCVALVDTPPKAIQFKAPPVQH
jgi:hypothetical protein